MEITIRKIMSKHIDSSCSDSLNLESSNKCHIQCDDIEAIRGRNQHHRGSIQINKTDSCIST